MDYEFSEMACPYCGHYPTYWRWCTEVHCDDGQIDVYNLEPDWYEPGDMERCETCHGTGVEAWCPSCGKDLNEGR